ncbi:MAG TPA: cell division protein FtsQ/DivIB [Rudaea sp.]|jgi:cell division protein FtsQ|uniref:cell division protein FtsQ/DivIB n=1 Tax=Rudaea sp. TaxID=2136325 RepID=UPI002F93474F
MNRRILKLFAWAIALTLVVLPVVGVLNGWFASQRWPIRNLQVEAEFNHVGAEQIRAAARNYLGTGFFAIKLDDIRAAVETLPWVEHVEVRKRWPDTIEMRVLEQQPFARWGDKRLVGRNGSLFAASGAESIQGLPQLDGPDDALADVVAFYNRTLLTLTGSGLALAGVSMSARGSWKLSLVDGSEVMLGQHDIDAHLQRFLDVFPRLAAGRGINTFARADLRYANGFAIRWPVVVPTAPASDKPGSDKPPPDKSGSAPPAGARTADANAFDKRHA